MADENENALVRVIEPYQAKVNITFAGSNGDLGDPISFDSTDADVKQMVTEAVRNGSVRGIEANVNADFTNYVVDRFAATEERPHALIIVRPKTAFGLLQANA